MSLAGDHHVVVTVQTHLDRAFQPRGGQGCHARKKTGLRLLAAECPAHAANLHLDLMVWQIQAVGYQVLHLCRVLSGAQHMHAVVFFGHGIGDLPLQVKLLLAADGKFAFESVLGPSNGLLGFATAQVQRREQEGTLLLRLLRGEYCG
ncbi:hypothetical protein D3C76_1210090 [compost metagenome]